MEKLKPGESLVVGAVRASKLQSLSIPRFARLRDLKKSFSDKYDNVRVLSPFLGEGSEGSTLKNYSDEYLIVGEPRESSE